MNRKRAYLVIQCLCCILLAILLCTGAVRIYREGAQRKAEHPLESIYTADALSDEFGKLAPALFVSIGLAAAGLILGIREDEKKKPVRDLQLERDLLVSRLRGGSAAVRKERKTQRMVLAGGWAAFGLCMIPVLIYLLNGAHFPERDVEGMIKALAAGTFPWICAGMACLIIAGLLEQRSVRREIEAAKVQLQEERKERESSGNPEEASGKPEETALKGSVSSGKNRVLLQGILIAAAAALIIAGIFNGGVQDVLIKASNICTECIGLG